MLRYYLLIGGMGFLGAVIRFALENVVGQSGFPVGTLAINVTACFVLVIVYSYVGRRLHVSLPLVRGMGVGFLGAFSTLSAFSNETLGLWQSGGYLTAALYVAVTSIGCFLAALAGVYCSRGFAQLRLRRLRAKRAQARREGEGGAK